MQELFLLLFDASLFMCMYRNCNQILSACGQTLTSLTNIYLSCKMFCHVVGVLERCFYSPFEQINSINQSSDSFYLTCSASKIHRCLSVDKLSVFKFHQHFFTKLTSLDKTKQPSFSPAYLALVSLLYSDASAIVLLYCVCVFDQFCEGSTTRPMNTTQPVRCSQMRKRKGRSTMKRVCVDKGMNPMCVIAAASVPSSFTVMVP